MKIRNERIRCPHCGGRDPWYEIDRLSALRKKRPGKGYRRGWGAVLATCQARVLCSVCHKAITATPERDKRAIL